MKSFLLMALAGLARRKNQTIITGAAVIVAGVLLCTSIGLLYSMNSPVEKMFADLNGAHILTVFEKTQPDFDQILNWWSARDDVEYVRQYNAYSWDRLSELSILTEGNILIWAWIFERPEKLNMIDQLVFIEGEEQPVPGYKEIWIPTLLADELNLNTGDTLRILSPTGIKEFLITAIVLDAGFNGKNMNPHRVWTAPGTISQIFGPEYLGKNNLALHFKDPKESGRIWNEFLESPGAKKIIHTFNYETMVSSYSFTFRLFFMFSLLFALFSLILIVIIIYSTFSGNVHAEYREIGILKASGFSACGIHYLYLVRYMIISLIAVPVVIIVSSILVPAVLSLMIRAVGNIEITVPYILIIILSGFIYLLFLFFAGLLITVRAGRVPAMDAIRLGSEQRLERRMSFPAISRLVEKMPLSAALAGLFSSERKGRAALNFLLVFLFSVFVFFALSAGVSVSAIDTNLPDWGIGVADIEIASSIIPDSAGYDSVYSFLANNGSVKNYYSFEQISAVLIPGPRDGFILGEVYDDDISKAGLYAIEGRMPQTPDEIALAVNSAWDFSLGIGNRVVLRFRDHDFHFTVSGVYQNTSNTGIGFKILAGQLSKELDFFPETYYINLADGVDKQEFIKSLVSRLPDSVRVSDYRKSLSLELRHYQGPAEIITGFLILIFSLVSLVIIFNSSLMELNERGKTIAVLKVLGLRDRKIRSVFFIKLFFVSVPAALLGVFSANFITAAVSNALIAPVLGMKYFPLTAVFRCQLITFVFITAASLLSVVVPLTKLSRINPRNLIIE